MFSDETIIAAVEENPQYVRRGPGEAFKKHCIVQHVKHPTSVMIWGAISVYGVGTIHVVEGTMNARQYGEVIDSCVLPVMNEWFPTGDGLFMQDSAPCHKAKVITQQLEENNINVLDWPGNSPDMNPIESIWSELKKKVKQKHSTTKQALINNILDVWRNDDELSAMCRTVVVGMPSRIQALLKAKGAHTKY